MGELLAMVARAAASALARVVVGQLERVGADPRPASAPAGWTYHDVAFVQEQIRRATTGGAKEPK